MQRSRMGCPMEGHYNQWGNWSMKLLRRCPIHAHTHAEAPKKAVIKVEESMSALPHALILIIVILLIIYHVYYYQQLLFSLLHGIEISTKIS